MNKPGKTYFTASSQTGRKLASAQAPLRTGLVELTPEQRIWNRKVEIEKLEKHKRKLEKMDTERAALKGETS